MEKDLKESLEWLKDCAENEYIFETGDSKLLLDYITNLQEENERLKNIISSIKEDYLNEKAKVDKTITYYYKTLNEYNKQNKKMPDEAVMMFNLMEGNK